MTYSRRNTVLARASGLAHQDAHPSDAKCADRLDVNRVTPYRWGRGAPSNPTHRFSEYLLASQHPWEVVAHAESIAKWKAIAKLSPSALLVRFWELTAAEKHIECADTVEGHQPGHSWADRVRTKRRDAAIELELCAVMTRFDILDITEDEVREGHQ